MTSLSTHVLDTVHGRPAEGVPIRVTREGAELFAGVTDADGRCPTLRELVLSPGRYAIGFAVAGYFGAQGVTLPQPPFLDEITIAFGIADEGHYHVPLLVSPFGYSTYRGS